MAMEITQFLVAAQSPDAAVRTEGENSLRQLQEQNLPQFLLALSLELANDDKPFESRRLAGSLLEKALVSNNIIRNVELKKQWTLMDTKIKSQMKNLLLRTLGSSALEARHTSAQVIAKMASIEIPVKQWPELVQSLLSNLTQQASPAPLKHSTLETLGYVFKEISHEDLVEDEVNSVLTAVVQGMNQSENSAEVRLAATKALPSVLVVARKNLEKVTERTWIMEMISKNAQSDEAEISQAAFKCLVHIASVYNELFEQQELNYNKVFAPQELNMLFQLTSKAISVDEESFVLHAMQFFSSICGRDVAVITNALSELVPILLQTLLKQEEDQDLRDDVRNISIAGGTCLGLVARTVGDAIVHLVTSFVEDNISEQHWRSREAAIYAFGSILEGPRVEMLAPLVPARLDSFLAATNHEKRQVRYTAAWTLRRIFGLSDIADGGYSFISAENLPRIVTVLLVAIRDVPNVAERICGAIYKLAQGYEVVFGISSLLSPHLPLIMHRLLEASERTDGVVSKLRAAAYETLNEVVRCSFLSEVSNTIARLLRVILGKLTETENIQTQASLCGVLQVIIQKLSELDEAHALVLQNAHLIGFRFEQAGLRRLCILCGFTTHFPATCKDLQQWKLLRDDRSDSRVQRYTDSWTVFHNALLRVFDIKSRFLNKTEDISYVFYVSFIEMQEALRLLKNLSIHRCFSNVDAHRFKSIGKELLGRFRDVFLFWSHPWTVETLVASERRLFILTLLLHRTSQLFLHIG